VDGYRTADEGLNFVFSKIVDSNVGDVSDAGMVYYILTGDEDTDPNKLRTFLNAGQGQTPPVSAPPARRSRRFDFVQTRRVQEHQFSYVPQRIGMRTWRDCVQVYLYLWDGVSTSNSTARRPRDLYHQPAVRRRYVQRWPMSTSPDWIITVSIANGRSISSSKNGTMRGGSLSQRVLMVTSECR
jgi:hypothetical protein